MPIEDVKCCDSRPEPTSIGAKEKELRDVLIEIDLKIRSLNDFVSNTELPECSTEEPKCLEENVSMNLYIARCINSNLEEIRNRF